jgi:small subunit ribosomal protein S4
VLLVLKRRIRSKMGDIKRKRKKFSRPKKPFDRGRMDEENVLVKNYGLKNKREIWKANAVVAKFRRRAKGLIGKDSEKQQSFFGKLNKMGLNVKEISDVLALKEESILERRLQTLVHKKKLANTPKQARQFITHRQVSVNGGVVDSPSFHVTTDLENKITIKERPIKKVEVKEEKVEEQEVVEEVVEDGNGE